MKIKNFFSFQNMLQGMLGVWIGSIILALSTLSVAGALWLYSLFFVEPEIQGFRLFFYGILITFYLLSLIFYHWGEEEGRIEQEEREEMKRWLHEKSEMKE